MKIKALNLKNSLYHSCKASCLEIKCKKLNDNNPKYMKHSIKTIIHNKRNNYNNHRNKLNLHAQNESNEDIQLNEYLLSRVIEAEEESERLKKELELLKKSKQESGSKTKDDSIVDETIKISNLENKNLTTKTGDVNFFSEADVDFLIGNETNADAIKNQNEIVKRRLIIGIGISIVIGILALIPSENFQFFKPTKNITLYLIPILRSQEIIQDTSEYVENAEWDSVRIAIDRIKNKPNYLKENMKSAAALLIDISDREKAQDIIFNVMEYLDNVDYNKYFESRLEPIKLKGGIQQLEFVKFSSNSLKLTKDGIEKFLNLFPKETITEAKKEIESAYN